MSGILKTVSMTCMQISENHTLEQQSFFR